MKKFTAIVMGLFMICLAPSCSNDEDSNQNLGELRLNGQVLSPNSAFPIARAKVKAFRGESVIAETTADALGNFTLENLPNGLLTIELSKGKFRKEVSINMSEDYTLLPSERNLDIFPSIAVVTGSFDEIESVLVNIGVVDTITGQPAFDIVSGFPLGRLAAGNNHFHAGAPMQRNSTSMAPNVDFDITDLLLDPVLLNSYDIIFFNCGAMDDQSSDPVAMANLKAFVDNGGIVYATDFMFTFVQGAFGDEDYMTFAQPEYGGQSYTANVQVGDADLEAWLTAQGIDVTPTVEINGFLGGWQMVDTFNSALVNDWAIADQVTYSGNVFTDKALAFTFTYGCGGVFYSSFHTHGNNSSEDTIEQMMHYFIFELSALQGVDCGDEM